jgi:hypothetical protein
MASFQVKIPARRLAANAASYRAESYHILKPVLGAHFERNARPRAYRASEKKGDLACVVMAAKK